MWSGSLIFVMPTSSGYLKRIRIKQPLVLGIFKTLKELPGYMKEPVNTWQFSRQLFDFVQKIENNSYK